MQMSEKLDKIAPAIVDAQRAIENIPTNDMNYYGKPFANLKSHVEVITPILHEYGLALMQFPTSDGNGYAGLRNVVMHTSGQWISEKILSVVPVSTTKLKKDNNGKVTGTYEVPNNQAQEILKINTMLRRCSDVGILNSYNGDVDTESVKSGEDPAKRVATRSNGRKLNGDSGGTDLSGPPEDAKDTDRYFYYTTSTLKMDREEAVAFLQSHNGDALAAYNDIISKNGD